MNTHHRPNTKHRHHTWWPVIAAVAATLVLSGCLSIFQEISANPSGKMETSVKLTISRLLLDSIAQMGGEPVDSNEIFNLDDGPFDPETIPGLTNVVVEKIDNDVDIGISFRGVLSRLPMGTAPGDAVFVPIEDGSDTIIALPPTDDEGEEGDGENPEDDEMAALFFATSKYQLRLDKGLYPVVTGARVESDGNPLPAVVTEYPTGWLIEFPILYWIQSKDSCLLVVNHG